MSYQLELLRHSSRRPPFAGKRGGPADPGPGVVLSGSRLQLSTAKEDEALAESRVSTEAKVEHESHLREAYEKVNLMINTIEELRNALTR